MAEIGISAVGGERRFADAPGVSAAATGVGTIVLLDRAGATAIAEEWRDLARRAAEDNVFFGPDFALPAMTHLFAAMRIATVRRADGRLTALAPVERVRLGRIAPAWRVFQHDYGPLGVPLVDPADLERAVTALIGTLSGNGSLIVPDLPLDGPVAAAMVREATRTRRPTAILDRHERAMLERPDGALDLRAGLPTRRRKEYQRQMRRLADAGPLSVETATDRDRVRACLEEFLALELKSWKGKGGTALASSPATAAMAREIVLSCAERGTARIDSIRLAGKPIAMVVSLVAGATAYTWKIAHDESHARFSPGAQLMLEAGGSLFSDPAVLRIDSCASANHPMIDHLWKDRMAIGTLVIGPPGGGALHRIGLAAMKAEIDTRAAAKRLIARLKARRNDNHAKETEN